MITSDSTAITIRPAGPDDELAILRLAALDSAPVPHGPLVLAEVDGEIRVAVSTRDLAAIADPFLRTAELVTLLRDHVERTHRAPAPAPRKPVPVALLHRIRLGLT